MAGRSTSKKMKEIQLTYTQRLPDGMQLGVLSYLSVSMKNTNEVIAGLWGRLNEFMVGEGPAWKQVTGKIVPTEKHGNRQWRCEAETAGRILRSQASRKEIFKQIYPLLSSNLIVGEGKRRRKDKKEIFAGIGLLKGKLAGDAGKTAYMLNLVEQACNYYLENDKFPASYEEMQGIPVLKTGMITFAGDDGGLKGQAYRYEIKESRLTLRLKMPDEKGKWGWAEPVEIRLSEEATAFVKEKKRLAAPTLRAVKQSDGSLVACIDIIVERDCPEQPIWQNQENVLGFDWGVRKLLTVVVLSPDGSQISRPFYLKTGGFDGKQARLRRQIDLLKAKRDEFSKDSRIYKKYQNEIDLCWHAYEKRNHALAHLSANFLLLLAETFGCHAIAGEWLSTLKSVGRGRSTNSRWRNWRNNTTIRSAITTILKYKSKLAGITLRFEQPRNTSHTCPRCHSHADTFSSPDSTKITDWGAWLICKNCGWNGSRDYAAAINIARLAVAFFLNKKLNPDRHSYSGFSMSFPLIKPASYIGAGSVLPFLPTDRHNASLVRLPHRHNRFFFAGWTNSVSFSPILLPRSHIYVCLHC